jgi:hypothetical protein
MSDNQRIEPVRARIVIHHAANKKGSDTGNMLKGCFFLPTEIKGFYNFYNKDGQTLATGVSSDNPFPVLLDDLAWTIQMGKIDDLNAQGSWRNNAPRLAEEQDGSFQASSGPGADTEATSAASA